MNGINKVVSDVRALKKDIREIHLKMDAYQEGNCELWNMIIDAVSAVVSISGCLRSVIDFQHNRILKAFKLSEYNKASRIKRRMINDVKFNGFSQFALRGTELVCDSKIYCLGHNRETVLMVAGNQWSSGEQSTSGIGDKFLVMQLLEALHGGSEIEPAFYRSRKLTHTPLGVNISRKIM
ncbi:hypothetical protein CHUAL_001528 [Chamberlinius hualienensis]